MGRYREVVSRRQVCRQYRRGAAAAAFVQAGQDKANKTAKGISEQGVEIIKISLR
jgi:hypothetical protein